MIATKDQERIALANIKEIVSDLGEGSYVVMALNGALSLASLNIENDAGFSCQDYIDKCHMYEEIMRDEKAARDALNDRIERLAAENETMNQLLREAESKRVIEMTRANKAEDRVEGLTECYRMQTMKLKAELYDMMVASKQWPIFTGRQ